MVEVKPDKMGTRDNIGKVTTRPVQHPWHKNYRPADASWDDPELLSVLSGIYGTIADDPAVEPTDSYCRQCFEDWAAPGDILCLMCRFEHDRRNR